MIELLGEKISNYEKLIEQMKEEQNLNLNNEEQGIQSGDEKYINLVDNNKKLKEELMLKENMINNIKKELKKISGIPDSLILDEFQSNMPLHTSGDANTNNPYMSPYAKNRAEQKSKNIKVNSINNEINPNEEMKQEMTKLRKENAELKFCLNNVNKKFENEIKEIRTNNELKEKELKETK